MSLSLARKVANAFSRNSVFPFCAALKSSESLPMLLGVSRGRGLSEGQQRGAVVLICGNESHELFKLY